MVLPISTPIMLLSFPLLTKRKAMRQMRGKKERKKIETNYFLGKDLLCFVKLYLM